VQEDRYEAVQNAGSETHPPPSHNMLIEHDIQGSSEDRNKELQKIGKFTCFGQSHVQNGTGYSI
jgi:hypothetical protein